MIKPLPCPFCGESQAVVSVDTIVCEHCRAEGPIGEIDDESLIRQWNTRADTSLAARLANTTKERDEARRLTMNILVFLQHLDLQKKVHYTPDDRRFIEECESYLDAAKAEAQQFRATLYRIATEYVEEEAANIAKKALGMLAARPEPTEGK